MAWVFEKALNRYRDTATGRFIGQADRVKIRDQWTDARKLVTDKMAVDYDSGKVPLSDWVTSMRGEIKTNYIEQYLLGAGGRNNMTQADWGRLGNAIRNQYHYLDGFAADLMNADPPLTLEQIQARSRLYIDGSTAMYERANTLVYGLGDLPEYPGDGSQICKSNCKCHWRKEQNDDGTVSCYWELDEAAQHCSTCSGNAAKYNPYILGNPVN